jgi:lysophospholipase L1-like esterase
MGLKALAACTLAAGTFLSIQAGCSRGQISRPTPVATPDTIAFVGDSITAAGPWQAAFPRHRVFNHGVPGDTSADVLARVPAIRSSGARTYVVMVGINDILTGLTVDGIAARIGAIHRELGATPDSRVLLQSTIPCEQVRCGARARAAVRDLNHRLRLQTPARDFLDLDPVLADSNGLRSAFTRDGVHLNPAGYARWLQRLGPLLSSPDATAP